MMMLKQILMTCIFCKLYEHKTTVSTVHKYLNKNKIFLLTKIEKVFKEFWAKEDLNQFIS